MYDTVALRFDCHRALASEVAMAIRTAVLGSLPKEARPRLLDLGAGTGRIGRSFAAAGDDYVGVDLSLGMLHEFAARCGECVRVPRLVQADGERLPFRNQTFDAVLLIQVVGAARDWRALIAEARRVLRPDGALVVGHTMMPTDGLDARMKQRLASLLEVVGERSYHMDTRGVVQPLLEAAAASTTRLIAAKWTAERTPRAFLERQPTGARFSRLPEPVRQEALRGLAAWAVQALGSLDAVFSEQHAFELQVFRF
jgi:ubiquinone/menaquinone biosynthesis C-methylase UbiE